MSLWWLMKDFFTKMWKNQTLGLHIFETKTVIKNLKDRFLGHILENISTKFQIPNLNSHWEISKNCKFSHFSIKVEFSENQEVIFLKKHLLCEEQLFAVPLVNTIWKYHIYFYFSASLKRPTLTFAHLSLIHIY